MKCTNHPEVDAAGMCVYCGKPFCKDCLIEVKGKMYCKDDISNVIDEAKNSSAAASPVINITNSNESSNVNTNTNTNNNANGTVPLSRKSKMVALILCALGFFGLAGLHKMYVGKIGSGILYFITCGWFFIGTIIDLISILSGNFRDNYGFYLK
jgi:TM2 domain-containing membrane protein YozV